MPQTSIKNLQGRSVVLDALCLLEDGTKCDVEVQKANDDDHVRRVRYNAACVTANTTTAGVNFKEVPNVIMIFISKFDIFNLGKTIYHIDRVIGGRKEMCEAVERYAREVAFEEAQEAARKFFEKGADFMK